MRERRKKKERKKKKQRRRREEGREEVRKNYHLFASTYTKWRDRLCF